MTKQDRQMGWAIGLALLIHAGAFVYWTNLPDPPVTAGAGALRLALAGDVYTRETQIAPLVTSEAEVPPTPEREPEPEPVVEPEPVRLPAPELPTRAAPRPPVAKPTAAVSPSPATRAQEATDARAEQGEGQAAADVGLGNADVEADYVAIVSAWLNRHKRYPRAAARRGLEGRGEVRFVVTRSGAVTRFEISGSTGFAILDRELKAMLERAAPLPSFPNSMPQAQLEIIVPVNFDHQS